MDVPSLPDEAEKSWDYPLTTDEMREHKDDWSLANDVGLLRHLQQFSENITSKVEKTKAALDDLDSGLNEASLMVDNVTNISLALANSQFIESRVQDDEAEASSLSKNEEKKNVIKEPSESEMIAAVSSSILEGLKIMDDKFERLEVLASSSSEEDEDDENEMKQSVILKPKDFYQNRGLPYVIGSDKWKSSSKIGLESSSSESEMLDDEEEEEEEDEENMAEYSDSEKETKLPDRIFSSQGKLRSRSSSCTSTSVSSDSKTGKAYTRSQDTLNSTSEIETITNEVVAKEPRKEPPAPSFAEELAKRLGNVFPARKKSVESDQASINRSQDDLFESDAEESSKKTKNLFGDTCDLFDDKLTSDLWKNKPVIRVQKNIIPSSVDVPPPISAVDVKPKSSIDDLFGDNNSEDSDDIFSPKGSWLAGKSQDSETEKKSDFVGRIKRVDNVMTSTPEANNNVPNFFKDDDEEDNDNLFSPFDKNISRINNEKLENSSRKVPGMLVNEKDLLSSALGSRLFNRKMNSDSSENESNEANEDNDNNLTRGDTFMVNESESMLFAGNIQEQQQQQQRQPDISNNENPSGDSGILMPQPRSVNSTLGLGLADWEPPQMESTRLRSEEIYREPILSDSVLTLPLNNPEITPPSVVNESSYNNKSKSTKESSSKLSNNNLTNYDDDDDEEDDDDVFSPPPLPQKVTSKIKSKVSSSLFDDSDSGDDLFSNTSSGSRSQKSTTDHQVAAAAQQYTEKSKNIIKSRGLFDEPYDLFSNTSVPDTDIFTASAAAVVEPPTSSKLNKEKERTDQNNLFKKVGNLFDDEDDDYLFGVTSSVENKKTIDKMEENKNISGSLVGDEILGERENKNPTSSLFDDIEDEDANNTSLFDDKAEKNIKIVDKIEEEKSNVPVVSKINKEEKEKVKNDCTKIEAPKTLKIRLPNVSDTDDTNQLPKRVVSNKIANIMGKMSNLKILSPTDTPPLFRKSTDKTDTDDDTSEYDSQDGSSVSLPKSLPQSPKKEIEIKNTPTSPSPPLETESAVSFDVPAQPETLLVRSKSRAKITAKRRPQSRHARQSALRHSGLDFDAVDAVDSNEAAGETIDRLSEKRPNISLNLTLDDKSEMSLGKESSISITKNTLLSPSTDEEDLLFDVPPDLPEDPQREDTLFGRGPILSPFDLDDAKKLDDDEKNMEKKEKIVDKEMEKDPLSKRDDDIFKDPSELFARVTKTPSPEKSRNQIFDEDDDSLFSEASNKNKNEKKRKEIIEEKKEEKKEIKSDSGRKKIDLFADDDDDTSDLFSGPFTKQIGKKIIAKTTRGLFDDGESDDDEGDDLFGSVSSKQSKSDAAEVVNIDAKKLKDEEDEDEEELFFDASEKSTETGKNNNQQVKMKKDDKKIENIFGDSESIDDDDDIFLTKNSKMNTGLFGDDEQVSSSSKSYAESRGEIKKPVTKDLKKTAEKIHQDPLSMFQDD